MEPPHISASEPLRCGLREHDLAIPRSELDRAFVISGVPFAGRSYPFRATSTVTAQTTTGHEPQRVQGYLAHKKTPNPLGFP